MNKSMIRREYIKADLRTRFGSLLAFDMAAGLPLGATTDFLCGKTSRPTAERVAQEIGISVDHLIRSLRESHKSDSISRNPGVTHRRIAA